MKIITALVACGLALGLANPAAAEQFNLKPQTFQQHGVFHNFEEDNCGNFFGELDQTGIRTRGARMAFFMDNLPGYNQFLVGFENRLDKGADPAPCNRVSEEGVETAFRFDVSEIQGYLDQLGRGQRVTALLTWEPVAFSFLRSSNTLQERPYESCRGSGFGVGRLLTPFTPGYVHSRVPAPSGRVFTGRLGERGDICGARLDADMRIEPTTAPVQESPPRAYRSTTPYPFRLQLDVSRIVRSWLSTDFGSAQPNFGLVLSPHAPPAFTATFNELELINELSFKLLHCWKVVKQPRLKVMVGE